MNPRLKQLMKELGDSINLTLSESEHISEVIGKIKAEDYDVFLVLEATIGFNRREESARDITADSMDSIKDLDPEFKVNSQDRKFLKSLRISVDEVKDKRAA